MEISLATFAVTFVGLQAVFWLGFWIGGMGRRSAMRISDGWRKVAEDATAMVHEQRKENLRLSNIVLGIDNGEYRTWMH